MNTTQEIKEYTIDATGKRLGRVATEIAHILMGKERTDMVKHVAAPVRVVVQHASKLIIDEKKRKQKSYAFYSGYPGGLRKVPMDRLIEKKGYAEVVRKAVYGMLPNNRLRAVRMKNLIVHE